MFRSQEQKTNEIDIPQQIEQMLSDEEDRRIDKAFITTFGEASSQTHEHESPELRRQFDSIRHAANFFERRILFKILQNNRETRDIFPSSPYLTYHRNEYLLVDDKLFYVNSEAQLFTLEVIQIDQFNNKLKRILKDRGYKDFDFEQNKPIHWSFGLTPTEYQNLFDGHVNHFIDYFSARRTFIEEVAAHASEIINTCRNQDLVIIFGQSDAGKSTLTNALAGVPLKKDKHWFFGRYIWEIENQNADTSHPVAKIDHDNYPCSKTKWLGMYQGQNNILLVDAPGFRNLDEAGEDITYYGHRIALTIAMKYARSVRIICALDVGAIYDDNSFKNVEGNAYHSFKSLIQFITEAKATPKSSVILALTKNDPHWVANMTAEACIRYVNKRLNDLMQKRFPLANFFNSIQTKIVVDYTNQEELRKQFYTALQALEPLTLDQVKTENLASTRQNLLQNSKHALMLEFFSVLKQAGLFYTNATADIALRAFDLEQQQNEADKAAATSQITPKPHRSRLFTIGLGVACGVVAVTSTVVYTKCKPN